ncbi:MAG: cellulase family glycosylhydrolase [Chloroflexota bacterium]
MSTNLRRVFFSVILLIAFISACAPGATPTTPIPTKTPVTYTITPSPQPPPKHRIGVRMIDGIGEFYDRVTGEKFIPRGNNYIRLAKQHSPSGETILYHSTFNPGLYDPTRIDETLQRMRSNGYNVVRVFLNNCCRQGSLSDPAGGLSAAYIANVADFLQRAKANGIFVLVTTDSEPSVGGTWSEDFGGYNASYLRRGGILSSTRFWSDFIKALIDQGAPLDAIFAYELRNELFFEANLPPLSLTSRVVSAANGKTYDMASDADKQRMMDENLVNWIDTVRASILEVDPTALVSVGFFWPQAPHPSRIGDPRVIETRPAIWESTADFIDLHLYPGSDLTLQEYVDNFKMAGMEKKPIIMGEFGAARSSYSSAAVAAQALHDWQVDSCQYGFNGWLLWTWDSDEQTDFYNALVDESQINQALAPVNRPDPCQSGALPFFEHNLALGRAVRASRSLPDKPPSNAVDGMTSDWWGAGAGPTQWIEIDLGEPSAIRLIRLVASQSPPGETLHQLWVGPAIEELYLLHTFEGPTADNQVLEFSSETPLEGVRYVRVVTRRSPSWVSWREIEVLAP